MKFVLVKTKMSLSIIATIPLSYYTLDTITPQQDKLMKKLINVDNVYNYDYLGFTNCVTHNGVIYITGQAGIDAQGNLVGPGIKEQAVKTFENIQTILEAAGASLADILAMTCFIVDIEKMARIFYHQSKNDAGQLVYQCINRNFKISHARPSR